MVGGVRQTDPRVATELDRDEVTHRAWWCFGGQIGLPTFAYTLPMEDGSGTSSN